MELSVLIRVELIMSFMNHEGKVKAKVLQFFLFLLSIDELVKIPFELVFEGPLERLKDEIVA